MLPSDPTQKIPSHVAIIMDGNGRWAQARGASRADGHRKGAEAARKSVQTARDRGIKYLTLFSFSAENWSRPADEVEDLMNLLRLYLKKETAELHKEGARLLVIGDRARLPADIAQLVRNAEDVTKDNAKITVIIALSYGGRQEIVFAARALAREAKEGRIDPESIDEKVFSQSLMTKGIPDPDLMIRTSGESRISNFLLWQMAYTEFYFTETLWPDFAEKEIDAALAFYASRDRRYGGRSSQEAGGRG